MNHRSLQSLRAFSLAPLALALGVLASAAVYAQTAKPMAPGTNMPHAATKAESAGTSDMKASMMMDMEAMQKMTMSGDTDKDFAMLMKMHHQQALKMAEMELAHGKSAAMKAMAKQIIAAQKKEIAEFDRWLATAK